MAQWAQKWAQIWPHMGCHGRPGSRLMAAKPFSALAFCSLEQGSAKPSFPAWHAGGQRFESAWLHPVRLLAPQGVFFVAQGVAGRPGGAEKRKNKRKLRQVTSRPMGWCGLAIEAQPRHGNASKSPARGAATSSRPAAAPSAPPSGRTPRLGPAPSAAPCPISCMPGASA